MFSLFRKRTLEKVITRPDLSYRYLSSTMKPKVFVTRSDYAKVGLDVLEKE